MTRSYWDLGLDTLFGLHSETLFVDDVAHWVTVVVMQTEPMPERDHQNRLRTIQLYDYEDVAMLLKDFWNDVD